ncbi:MAG: hypothetical protein IMY72_11825 [Bacteroidetes bacterium]|nr:hypothetical protein [Bacteroidota bacterium]
MEIIYQKIIDTFNANKKIFINRNLPVIRQIDINYGQPDDPQNFEVFQPAIYISWQISNQADREPSTLTLEFHVLQEPGAHTENYSERLPKGKEYLLMLKTIKYILNKLRASNTTGLKYTGERPNITPFFNYHILTYTCFIDDGAGESLTKGSLTDVELTDYDASFSVQKKETPPTPTAIDTFK